MEKCWLLTYYDTSGVGQKAVEVAQKKEQKLAHGEFYP